MNSIKKGSRGSAVEDIQRRLNYLGYSIGSSGVDGVFLEDTAEAVRLFQASVGLNPDGIVDSETWSQLVDSTFRFGDRLLYLRYPLFHGQDVEILQTALNSLGFTTGEIDGIFGAGTEAAVCDFQSNMLLPADGVVGFATFEALQSMKHMWEGREIISHSEARKRTMSRRGVLKEVALKFYVWSPLGLRIARRIQNLAIASLPTAEIMIEDLYSSQTQISFGTNGVSPLERPILHVGLQLDACALDSEFQKVAGDFTHKKELSVDDPASTDAVIIPSVELNFEKSVLIPALKQIFTNKETRLVLLRVNDESTPLTSSFSPQAIAVYILDSICAALS